MRIKLKKLPKPHVAVSCGVLASGISGIVLPEHYVISTAIGTVSGLAAVWLDPHARAAIRGCKNAINKLKRRREVNAFHKSGKVESVGRHTAHHPIKGGGGSSRKI